MLNYSNRSKHVFHIHNHPPHSAINPSYEDMEFASKMKFIFSEYKEKLKFFIVMKEGGIEYAYSGDKTKVWISNGNITCRDTPEYNVDFKSRKNYLNKVTKKNTKREYMYTFFAYCFFAMCSLSLSIMFFTNKEWEFYQKHSYGCILFLLTFFWIYLGLVSFKEMKKSK